MWGWRKCICQVSYGLDHAYQVTLLHSAIGCSSANIDILPVLSYYLWASPSLSFQLYQNCVYRSQFIFRMLDSEINGLQRKLNQYNIFRIWGGFESIDKISKIDRRSLIKISQHIQICQIKISQHIICIYTCWEILI